MKPASSRRMVSARVCLFGEHSDPAVEERVGSAHEAEESTTDSGSRQVLGIMGEGVGDGREVGSRDSLL